MSRRSYWIFMPVVLLVALVAIGGCKKKESLPPPETAPVAVPAPTAQTHGHTHRGFGRRPGPA